MKRKSGMILATVLVLCMFAGCKKPSEDKVPTITPTPSSVRSDLVSPTASVGAFKTAEVPIYTVSGDFAELTAVTALVSAEEEITETVVSEAVVAALADNAIYVKVNDIIKEDTVVIVDFDGSAPPAAKVSASVEGLILDAFGQSILDNVKECSGVGFSVDGEAYVSGHFEFEKGSVYMRR